MGRADGQNRTHSQGDQRYETTAGSAFCSFKGCPASYRAAGADVSEKRRSKSTVCHSLIRSRRMPHRSMALVRTNAALIERLPRYDLRRAKRQRTEPCLQEEEEVKEL